MKKLLIGLVIIIAIIGIAATVFVGKMDGLIADVIRTEGTAAIGTQVNVKSVETKLKEGTATIKGLTIANPNGYKKANALSIDSFTADVDYKTQVVNSIIIDKPTINAEIIDVQKNNFQDLLDGMPESAPEEETASDEPEQEFTIKSFQLNQAQVNVTNDKLGERSFVMQDFRINNLTGTVDEISDEITRRLTNHVSSQVTEFAKVELGNILKEEATKQLKEKASEKLNEAVGEEMTDKIKGLKGLKFKLK